MATCTAPISSPSITKRHRPFQLFSLYLQCWHMVHGTPGPYTSTWRYASNGGYQRRQKTNGWLEKTAGPRPRNVWLNNVQKDAKALLLSTLRSEIARGHGAAQRSTRTTRRRRWWWCFDTVGWWHEGQPACKYRNLCTGNRKSSSLAALLPLPGITIVISGYRGRIKKRGK